MRVYCCPEHPEKPYTSWRKFRGHWSTQHRGEECPPREEFLQEMEKGEIREQKKEFKESGGFPQEEAAYGKDIPLVGGEGLPEDPVQRLATILDVHGVDKGTRDNLLAIFQLHPGYKDNPVNLHYLLTAKLPRKFHSSIPMMISEFTAQESAYPEGVPLGMMPGMGGPQAMPPFMYGMGYQPTYPSYPSYNYLPRPPMGGREVEGEEGSGRRRERERDPVKDAVALLGTLMEFKDRLMPERGSDGPSVQEVFEGFRSTIEEVTKDNKEQQDKLLAEIRRAEEDRRKDLDGIKDLVHQEREGRLQDRIEALMESKDEERSEGLGTLLKDAGEGAGVQLDGLRQSVNQGVNKLGDIITQAVAAGPPGGPILRGTVAGGGRSVGEASALLEAEAEVENIARELEGSR